jgi:hypothetical protein
MTTLFLWVVVHLRDVNDRGHWEKLEAYATPEYCHRAAATLVIDKSIYRCVSATGEQQ